MKNDIFAGIASGAINTRRGQIQELPPPKLPRKFLPASKSDPKAAFRPAPKLATEEALQAELSRQRRRYEPFLKDLAPVLPAMRIIVSVHS